MLSPEELLKPRYKVIAEFPQNESYPLGDIVRINTPKAPGFEQQRIEFYDKYPALFRKLKWWEEREPEEMPEYVKYKTNSGWVVIKVKDYDGSIATPADDPNDEFLLKPEFDFPATETEYNEYIKLKTNDTNKV